MDPANDAYTTILVTHVGHIFSNAQMAHLIESTAHTQEHYYKLTD
jgi:hypothetical protein